jgi:molybdopterin converting factor small subunit
MRVRVLYTGLLRRYIGEKDGELELPEGSTVRDLLEAVAQTHRDRFPSEYLRGGGRSLLETVRASRRGGTACEPDQPLEDGEEILLLSRLAGG